MSSFQKRIFREIKKTKHYFLNWPVNKPIEIGSYGRFNGRRADFDWIGNVASAGITFQPMPSSGTQDEQYRTKGQVDVVFDTDAATPAKAAFTFNKSTSIAFESYGGTIQRVSVDQLAEQILYAVGAGKLVWHPDYVVVTEIYTAESFSSFVSGAKKAKIDVVATKGDPVKPFNTADPKIGVRADGDSNMSYFSVAQKNVKPYFIAHKFESAGHNTAGVGQVLRKYTPGLREGFF